MTLSQPSQSVCYYFGTFNPIHIGHLMIAQSALLQYGEALGFSHVCLIPAASPPHRQNEPDMLDARLRLRLVCLAVQDNPSLQVSDIEFSLPTPAYTIDTFKALQASNAAENPITMIIGSDALAGLASWKNYRELIEAACFLQAPRPGLPFVAQIDSPEGILKLNTRPIDMPVTSLSSTWIREQLQLAKTTRNTGQLRYFLPESVRQALLSEYF